MYPVTWYPFPTYPQWMYPRRTYPHRTYPMPQHILTMNVSSSLRIRTERILCLNISYLRKYPIAQHILSMNESYTVCYRPDCYIKELYYDDLFYILLRHPVHISKLYRVQPSHTILSQDPKDPWNSIIGQKEFISSRMVITFTAVCLCRHIHTDSP